MQSLRLGLAVIGLCVPVSAIAQQGCWEDVSVPNALSKCKPENVNPDQNGPAVRRQSSPAAPNSERNIAAEFVRRGKKQLSSQAFDSAIEQFGKAIAADARSAEAFAYRAMAFGRKGDYESAIKDFSRAITLAPRKAVLFYNRGVSFTKTGDQLRALKDYDRAIELQPKYADALNNRGVIYRQNGKLDLAIVDFEAALRAQRTHPLARQNLEKTIALKAERKQASSSEVPESKVVSTAEGRKLGKFDFAPSVEARELSLHSGETLQMALLSEGATPERVRAISGKLGRYAEPGGLNESYTIRLVLSSRSNSQVARDVLRVTISRASEIVAEVAVDPSGQVIVIVPPSAASDRKESELTSSRNKKQTSAIVAAVRAKTAVDEKSEEGPTDGPNFGRAVPVGPIVRPSPGAPPLPRSVLRPGWPLTPKNPAPDNPGDYPSAMPGERVPGAPNYNWQPNDGEPRTSGTAVPGGTIPDSRIGQRTIALRPVSWSPLECSPNSSL